MELAMYSTCDARLLARARLTLWAENLQPAALVAYHVGKSAPLRQHNSSPSRRHGPLLVHVHPKNRGAPRAACKGKSAQQYILRVVLCCRPAVRSPDWGLLPWRAQNEVEDLCGSSEQIADFPRHLLAEAFDKLSS